MKTQRRIYGVVAARKVRSGLWCSWCGVNEKPEAPRLLSWSFLRSVWSLFCLATGRRVERNDEERLHWGHKPAGCYGPRASAIYGRVN